MGSDRYPREPRGLAAIMVAGVGLTYRGWTCVGTSIVAFVAAYGSGKPQLLSIGSLFAVLPVIAILYVALRRPRVQVTRSFVPHVVPAGSPATVMIEVRNRSAWPSRAASWSDELEWSPFTTAESDLPRMTARGSRFARGSIRTLRYSLTPPRRGVFEIGPCVLRFGDAFGLAHSVSFAGASAPLIVTPEVTPLAAVNLTVPAGDGTSRIVQRRSSGDDDDTMTREYRQGDAMRRVHWRATARKGDLMVRQEEQRSFPDARLILDTRRAAYRPRPARSRARTDSPESEAFEWAVRMLASIAARLRLSGFHVTVEETGTPQLGRAASARRPGRVDEDLREQLASVALVDGTGLAHHERRPGPVIGVLGEADSDVVDWMLHEREPGELAVAFVVRTAPGTHSRDHSSDLPTRDERAIARLVDAGWLVVDAASDDDLAAAWDRVVAGIGWMHAAR
jgi:uncharacterized protein (DUF58 family)